MTALLVRGLSKSFGGLLALDQVDLLAPSATILSIIGPNGSGKTTLFNCISGLYQADAGSACLVRDDGEFYLGGLRPDQVTRAGLARTFQGIRLFPQMTVLENVLVGMHGRTQGGLASVLLRTRRFCLEEASARQHAVGLLEFFGEQLCGRAEDMACNLSYANQRRLEMSPPEGACSANSMQRMISSTSTRGSEVLFVMGGTGSLSYTAKHNSSRPMPS